ncbi:MAG: class I SAM-dependent rRNA methyltransferase [Armatimonadota bacterium]|nr:class I SAM-dependent rRNA methyltransferase [Armatimonadota bacterium]MDR7567276.1 class I SAM-dependent rRNA methyltransferase [Armatimonadota bacterium]
MRDLEPVEGAVVLHRGRERRILPGHLWVYEGEVAEVRGNPAPGAIVDVLTSRGAFCARGFYNPHSKIRVRILTFEEEPIRPAFFARRIAQALALRERVVRETTAYRVVYAEGDLLPGLIVDRYGDLLVMQTLAVGMDNRKELLADLLLDQTGARAVYLRNDSEVRSLEGLPRYQGFLRGELPTRAEIAEGPARFVVDVAGGQKTGWFCDQRENRLSCASLAQDAEVLEVFSYTGAFGIHAALQGARSVLGMDVSKEAVALARENARLNGVLDRCRYEVADAFEALRTLGQQGARWDLVILDPPAFARRKEAVRRALAGYKEINLRALLLLRPGGYLVSCSCSSFVDEGVLWGVILEAARDAGRRLRLLELRGQARDHPMLGAMPETRYLKCFVLQTV